MPSTMGSSSFFALPARRPALPARRPALLAALVGLLSLSLLLPAPPAAAAEDVHPATGPWQVSGHGWGHGRGMSQVGAHGAALSGLAAPQILEFYYPGTTAGTVPADAVSVLLSGDVGHTGSASGSLEVFPGDRLTATDLATGRALVLPAGPDRWRVLPGPSAGRLRVEHRSGGSWSPWAFDGAGEVAGPLQLSVASGLLRRAYPGGGWREYRGVLRAVGQGAGGLVAAAVLPMEDYLRAVVPGEMPLSGRLTPAQNGEALRAQAVAARSYADTKRRDSRAKGLPFDLCDSTRCQVFPGTVGSRTGSGAQPVETASADAAVAGTAHQVRQYGGRTAMTEYSASNGGFTVATTLPYQVAKADPYDGLTGSPSHAWSATLTPADLQAAFPAVGRLVRVRITERDGGGQWGGRVRTVVLEGVDGAGRATAVTTTGAAVYAARRWPGRSDGLRSTWFTLGAAAAPTSPTPTSPTPTSPAPTSPAPTPPPPPPAPTPVGNLDGVQAIDGGVSVRGWALDQDAPTAAVGVHVYVDGAASASLSAALPRPDVAAAYPGAGQAHGFAARVHAAPGRRAICVYALDLDAAGGRGTAGNPLLGCRTVTVDGDPDPAGVLDAAGPAKGGVRVQGWALDRSSLDDVQVQVLLDGVLVTTAPAATRRPDVGLHYPVFGDRRGFDVVVPARRGARQACARAVNLGEGRDSLLGCVELEQLDPRPPRSRPVPIRPGKTSTAP